MAGQSVSSHGGQEGQHAGVHRRSRQLTRQRDTSSSPKHPTATRKREKPTVTRYLWDQVRQHGATLHCHDLLQAVQSELSRLLVILRTDVQ